MHWRNWSGEQACIPALFARPASTADVVREVERAAAAGQVVRVAGAGHSFNDCVVTSGTLLSLDAMDEVLDVDRAAGRVRVQAGIRLHALADRLPEHLVPGHFVALDRLPLTPNGKTDRAALPAVGTAAGPESGRAPRAGAESLLCDLFADVLGRDVVIPADPGVGARGAVLVAARALYDPFDEDAWAANARTVTVQPHIADVYERGYAHYLDSLDAARQRWSR